MTTAEALDKVQEFRQLLDLLDKEEKRPPFGSRFWVMQFLFGFSRRGR